MVLLQWLWEGFVSGIAKVGALWWLVPLFVAIQWLKDSGWLDRLARLMKPVLSPLRLPGEAGVPVVAALTVGLSYGAGVILQAGEDGKLSRNELTVTCVFVGITHALIEETILFTGVGANGVLLITVRVVLGLLFAWGASQLLLRTPAPAPAVDD